MLTSTMALPTRALDNPCDTSTIANICAKTQLCRACTHTWELNIQMAADLPLQHVRTSCKVVKHDHWQCDDRLFLQAGYHTGCHMSYSTALTGWRKQP